MALVGAVTAVRVVLLFLSPLELYPDEAQYWVWSRSLAFGYFSKPPMIAWLIRATTAVGGDGEAWVRLSSPLLHGAAALALFQAAQTLYNPRAGLCAAIVYTLMPGIQLSSALISTDAPLLLFVSLSVWAYAVLWKPGPAAGRLWISAALGAALGAGLLTKYATLYIAGGVILHALMSREARRRWRPLAVMTCLGMGLIIASPNLIWNMTHDFQTVAHTAENADLGGDKVGLRGLLGARGPFGFLLGQIGVFGPVAFAVALGAAVKGVRRSADGEEMLLVCLAAPALLLVLVESIAARANANWAGAAYAPATVLVAGSLERWRARNVLSFGVGGVQGIMSGCIVLALLIPSFANAVGSANAFKRARGWREDAAAVVSAARKQADESSLSAIGVDDRFLFNALSYYARDASGRPAAGLPAPLKMWVRLARPANQAETETPLTAEDGRRVLGLSATPSYLAEFRDDFVETHMSGPIIVALDPRHTRKLDVFLGDLYRPRPRDLVTGLPIAP